MDTTGTPLSLRRWIVRLVHRLIGHRFEGCTLVDLRGDKFVGRCCRCGVVDEEAWQWVGSVYSRSTP